MARKKRVTSQTPEEIIKEAILSGIERLYDKHLKELQEYREEADDHKVALTFNILIDNSETEVAVETKIRFSQSVTDAHKFSIDPNQKTFTEIEDEVAEETGAKEGRKRGKTPDYEPEESKTDINDA